MRKLGEILKETRISKHISQDEAAKHLLQKKEVVEALEEGNWQALPQSAYVRGFITSYAKFLGLDQSRLLALYRAEYDEAKYAKISPKKKKRLMFTPNLLTPMGAAAAVLIFVAYLLFQYTSVLKAPELEVFSPQNDITTSASVVEVTGKAELESTVSVEGELVPLDQFGNFTYQIKLQEGQNFIEVIASKRLSPKTKIERIVRLSR